MQNVYEDFSHMETPEKEMGFCIHLTYFLSQDMEYDGSEEDFYNKRDEYNRRYREIFDTEDCPYKDQCDVYQKNKHKPKQLNIFNL